MQIMVSEDCLTGPDFTALFEKYRERLCYFLTRALGGDFDEAQNIAQDSFVLFLEKVTLGAKFADERSAVAFLFSSARNLAMNARRKSSYRRIADTLIHLAGGLFRAPDPFREAEACADFDAALARIPEIYREVMVLKYIAELSEEQIAETMGISIGTVKSRYYNGSLKMSEFLNDYSTKNGDGRNE